MLVQQPEQVPEAFLAFRIVILQKHYFATGYMASENRDLPHLLVGYPVRVEPYSTDVQTVETDHIVGAFDNHQAQCFKRLAQPLVLQPVLPVLTVKLEAAMEPSHETVFDGFIRDSPKEYELCPLHLANYQVASDTSSCFYTLRS